MSKKTFLPPKIAPLQRIIGEPITDPAEQAAIDKLRKRKKRNEDVRDAQRRKPK